MAPAAEGRPALDAAHREHARARASATTRPRPPTNTARNPRKRLTPAPHSHRGASPLPITFCRPTPSRRRRELRPQLFRRQVQVDDGVLVLDLVLPGRVVLGDQGRVEPDRPASAPRWRAADRTSAGTRATCCSRASRRSREWARSRGPAGSAGIAAANSPAAKETFARLLSDTGSDGCAAQELAVDRGGLVVLPGLAVLHGQQVGEVAVVRERAREPAPAVGCERGVGAALDRLDARP